MGKTWNTSSLAMALVSRYQKKRALRRIAQLNEARRRITALGAVGPADVLPDAENLLVAGGDAGNRRALLVENCLRAVAQGLPVVVLHEHHAALEQALEQALPRGCLRQINQAHPCYEPLFSLGSKQYGPLLGRAVSRLEPNGMVYAGAVCQVLEKIGKLPTLQMLARCHLQALPAVTAQLEQIGSLSYAQAEQMRYYLSQKDVPRELASFLQQLAAETDLLAQDQYLSQSTCIRHCIRRGGVLTVDVGSFQKEALLGLLTAELINDSDRPCHVILDAASLAGCDGLLQILRSASCFSWCLSAPDLLGLLDGKPEAMKLWLSLARRSCFFFQSLQSAGVVSAALGSYEKLDLTQSQGSGDSLGQMGFHASLSANISTTVRREPVVQPEELQQLSPGHFYLLDNVAASLSRGSLI